MRWGVRYERGGMEKGEEHPVASGNMGHPPRDRWGIYRSEHEQISRAATNPTPNQDSHHNSMSRQSLMLNKDVRVWACTWLTASLSCSFWVSSVRWSRNSFRRTPAACHIHPVMQHAHVA